MLALYLAVMAAAWLIEAADNTPTRNVHGSVVFVRTGERTPLLKPGTPKLTPLGAQQMHTLGQQFRGRYMGDESFSGLGHDPINGLMPDILAPNQLFIQSLDTPYLYASAQAFMQGLYPPYSIDNGTVMDANGILSNGSAIDYPLHGYQYAPIQVVGELDPNSVYIAGDQNCPMSTRQSMMYQTTEEYLNTKTSSDSFYNDIDASYFNGLLKEGQIDYYNAFQIYDYLNYQYNHDRDTFEAFANDSSNVGVFERLRAYADESAWYFWGNTSTSSSDADLQAMAGKTLAARILGSLQNIYSNNGNTANGNSPPLTLLFGEHEPIISLISLMMLDYRNDHFRSIPPFASAMVFELFSTGSDATFPSNPEDLWVTFHYQNGTTFGKDLTMYPVFGRDPSQTEMPWLEFQDMMSRTMTNTLTDWCDACSSGALFCWGVDNTNIAIIGGSSGKAYKVSPTVAGVIGAIVTLAVAAIIFALAMLVGGIRFHRVSRSKKSELGGFKGSAKLASDQDLNLPKNGAMPAGIVSMGTSDNAATKRGHERVGSWELRQKELGKGNDFGDVDADARSRASFEAIESAMSSPVEPHVRV